MKQLLILAILVTSSLTYADFYESQKNKLLLQRERINSVINNEGDEDLCRFHVIRYNKKVVNLKSALSNLGEIEKNYDLDQDIEKMSVSLCGSESQVNIEKARLKDIVNSATTRDIKVVGCSGIERYLERERKISIANAKSVGEDISSLVNMNLSARGCIR